MGGTQADYEQWALEVPGVTRAFVTQEMGRGTVTVRFMMDGTYPDGVPKDGDRQAVAAHIETVRPVTADVYVVLPVADPLNLRLRITPGHGRDPSRRRGEPLGGGSARRRSGRYCLPLTPA